jgi:hypothetical protein
MFSVKRAPVETKKPAVWMDVYFLVDALLNWRKWHGISLQQINFRILWCRRYCAELVAAVLKKGGLMDQSSNPGAATPESLHTMYSRRAATTGNPTLLRDVTTLNSLKGVVSSPNSHERELLIARQHMGGRPAVQQMVGNLRVVAARQAAIPQTSAAPVTLTLNSLDMRRPQGHR